MRGFFGAALRWAFATASWFLAFGLFVLAIRADLTGHMAGLALMGAVFVVNGFLIKPSLRKGVASEQTFGR